MMNDQNLAIVGFAIMFVVSLAVVIHDMWIGLAHRPTTVSLEPEESGALRLRTGIALTALAWLPLIIVIIAEGL
jgi:hypothetical protein